MTIKYKNKNKLFLIDLALPSEKKRMQNVQRSYKMTNNPHLRSERNNQGAK